MVHSVLAAFDDIRPCVQVLTDGSVEEEFLRFLSLEEKYRSECNANAQEIQRLHEEYDKSLEKISNLELKLLHARRIIDVETKARREAEYEREQMERKVMTVIELLQHERNLNNETRDKLASLDSLSLKLRRSNPSCENDKCNEINTTSSLLSDLSITLSEDDLLDVRHSKSWHEHRPTLPKNSEPYIGNKKSRLRRDSLTNCTLEGRRSLSRHSGVDTLPQALDTTTSGVSSLCANTKFTTPQDCNKVLLKQSKIESLHILKDFNDNVQISDGLTSTPKQLAAEQSVMSTPLLGATCTSSTAELSTYDGTPSRCLLKRNHNFNTKTFLRGDNCTHCQKRIRFGVVGLRCRVCPVRCHVDCRYFITLSCVPQSGTPTIKGMMGYLCDYAPNLAPMVPALIVHCVNEIEARGLTEVGLYRVSATEREYKSLKEQFLRGKGTPHLANMDVHVLCGCIKDFLLSLREPLVPTSQWIDFCNAIQNPDAALSHKLLCEAVEAMPQANRDTLSFLILHFQRVAQCPAVLMPIDNIALVFGPTIVGYSSLEPNEHAIFIEVHTQSQVMTRFLRLPSTYWERFLQFEQTPNAIANNSKSSSAQHTKRIQSDLHAFHAAPLKFSRKKRTFYATPPFSHK